MVSLPTIDSIKSHIKRFIVSSPEIVPGTKIGIELDIDSLICPLRYDIVVRIEFFRFLEQEWDLYTSNLSSFLNAPPVKNYYIWFKEVATARFEPKLYHHDELIMPKFIERVHKSAALWASMETNGLDASNPIRLRSGKVIHCVNEKKIHAQYYAGDGCHRMACLYVNGARTLQPKDYEVVIFKEFQPLDNTDILYKKLPLSTADYCRFISSYYCNSQELSTINEILQYIETHRHELLPVVRSIVTTIRNKNGH